jgi:hypothetical protein
MLLLTTITEFFANSPKLVDFFIRLGLYSLTVFVLIRYIYYPKNGKKEMIFTYFIMGLVVFFVCILLDRVDFNLGLAIGLFAIFSIIRFRSPSVDLKEITYLFAIIGLAIINALVKSISFDFYAVIVVDVLILPIALFFESYSPRTDLVKKPMTFRVSDLGILNDKQALLDEVKKETNIDIVKIEIDRINGVKKELTLWIYYKN